VIGPDEYHAGVDDNAYTNLMARWNLRRAADTADDDDPRASEWRAVAASLVDGYDARWGLHEQFAGYWRLEPLRASDVGRPPFPADLVLGADRCTASQLAKQADVLMAHHLIGEELAPGSLPRDLDFYAGRCSHGSSLSPAVQAAALARVGRTTEALALFDLAAHLSLDDLTRTTSGGVHLAAMGGVWQALVFGFLGVRPAGDVLDIDPHLPAGWASVELALRYRGQRLRLLVDGADVLVGCERPLRVRVGGREAWTVVGPTPRPLREAPR
jgi:trehalose/maltose hydrolase-like predicted phosphorylase